MDIPKQVRILDTQKSYFGYQKQQFRISENKHLFQLSKIVIMDIRNNYFRYPELTFIPFFQISKKIIPDIRKRICDI